MPIYELSSDNIAQLKNMDKKRKTLLSTLDLPIAYSQIKFNIETKTNAISV